MMQVEVVGEDREANTITYRATETVLIDMAAVARLAADPDALAQLRADLDARQQHLTAGLRAAADRARADILTRVRSFVGAAQPAPPAWHIDTSTWDDYTRTATREHELAHAHFLADVFTGRVWSPFDNLPGGWITHTPECFGDEDHTPAPPVPRLRLADDVLRPLAMTGAPR